MGIKRKHCKLDDRCNLSLELEEIDGKTFMNIVDRCHTHEQTARQGFANISTYVDKYRLLQLADFIYDYCNNN